MCLPSQRTAAASPMQRNQPSIFNPPLLRATMSLFSPDGGLLAIVCADNRHTLTIYDIGTGGRATQITPPCAAFNGAPPQVFAAGVHTPLPPPSCSFLPLLLHVSPLLLLSLALSRRPSHQSSRRSHTLTTPYKSNLSSVFTSYHTVSTIYMHADKSCACFFFF